MSENERSLKRQRISRACDQCRKRKSKCGGEQPTCSICRTHDRICTYFEVARKRGLQPGYVRALEIVLGLAVTNITGGENSLRRLLRSDFNGQRFLDPTATDEIIELWRSSAVAGDVEQLLLLQEDAGANPSGDLLCPLLSPADEHNGLDSTAKSLFTPVTEQTNRSHVNIPGNSESYPALADILHDHFPTYAVDLIEQYFTSTHYWFPILERREVLRVVYAEKSVRQLDNEDIGIGISIWAIIAYELGRNSSTPDVTPEFDTHRLSLTIQSLLSQRLEIYDLGDIQTILILALRKLGAGRFHNTWIQIGQAARMLVSLRVRSQQLPTRFWHTYNGCIFLDHFVSAIVDQRPSLPYLDLIEKRTVDEQSLDEWDMWLPLTRNQEHGLSKFGGSIPKRPLRALSIFNELLLLISKLGEVLNATHPIDARTFTDLWNGLHQWRDNLADHCKIKASVPTPPQLLNLHLSWAFTMCTLLRYCQSDIAGLAQHIEEPIPLLLDLAPQFVELMGPTGSSPLLFGFCSQAQNCLKVGLSRRPIDNTVQIKLQELVDNLEWKIHPDERRKSQTTHRNQSDSSLWQSSTHHLSAPKYLSNMVNKGQTTNSNDVGRRPTAQLIQHETQERERDLSIPPDDAFVRSLPEGEAVGLETNDFDTLFEEMIALAPPRRTDHELSFAHNLGFMTNDFSSEFLSFLQLP